MAWTNGAGVVISTEKGWTLDANRFVEKKKKWGGGQKHSGGAGLTSRGYHVIMRALAEAGVAARKRSEAKSK